MSYPQRRALPAADRKLWTLLDAASALGITRKHLYTMIARGEINSVKLGRRRMITGTELDHFVATLEREAS